MGKFEDSLKEVHPKTRQEWRHWLEKHHEKEPGVWLVFYKLASGKRELTYEDAVKEALAFGWIDSKPAKIDEERYKLTMTPRKPGSGWSRINKQHIEELMKEGQMARAGLDKIEAAKKDGSWDELDRLESLEVPDELQAALKKNKAAAEKYNALTESVKRQLHYQIRIAKQEATRTARIEKFVADMAAGKNPMQWEKKGK